MKITLCGSTRFMDKFNEWNVRLSKAGHVVYSVATSTTGDFKVSDEEKIILDEVHKKKIDNSEAILVLNYGDGYIGDSTKSEIRYAMKTGKEIYVVFISGHCLDGCIGSLDFPIKKVCPYAGCYNPLNRPPCALCYE